MPASPARRLFALVIALVLVAAGPAVAPLRAQRQMEALGRGVVAMRTSSTQVYVGWRLLGDDPSDLGFNLYRSIGGGAATKLNGATPITASTNYVDTPGSFASAISYYVVPVRNNIEQTPSAAYTLAANATSGQQFIRLPLSTATPNPDSTYPYTVKFCWVGDFDGDGEYDFLVDRVSTSPTAEKQFLEAYRRDGTFLWRMDMGANSVNQYAYEPGSSAIDVGDTDNVTVYDLDGDGKAEVAVRTANGVTVTNAAGAVVATISAASDASQFVSIIDGLSGVEKARATLPNPWAQYGTLTSKCAIGYFDGQRPSVLFYGYNREDNAGPFHRVFSTFDYRDGQLTQRWSTAQTFHGSEGHQIRIADVDNDGKDEVCDIGHVIDDDGTQLFDVAEISHGDRFHIADIDPDRPGLETYAIQQLNPSFLATIYYDSGTGQVLKKWYATDVVDVGRGIALDINSTHKGYEMYSTQPGIYNAKAQQIYANNVWAPEGLWWDADLLREFIDGAGSGALNPVINKFNQTTGVSDRVWSMYNDAGSYSITQAYGGRPAFWGDILGDWREELVFVTTDYTALRIYTTVNVASNRLYTLMHNPAYRCQATTKGYVQSSNVDYYLGIGMTTPPPPPMVPADLAWAGGAGAATWNTGATAAWKNTATSAASAFAAGQSVRFDLGGSNAAPVALSGVLQPGDVTVYSPIDYTFDGSAGSLGGTMKLVKAGKGSLRITGAHAFTGATTVWDGALRIDGTLSASPVTVWGGVWGGPLAKGLTGGRLSGSGIVSQPVSLQYRGAITPGTGMNAAGTLSLGAGLTAVDGSTLAFDVSSDPTGTTAPSDRLAITGSLSLSGTVSIVINPLSGQLSPGTYTLLTYTGALTGSAANLSVVIPDGVPYSISLASGSLKLVIPVTRAPGALVWSGAVDGNWDLANTPNWKLAGASDVFVGGDSVAFDDTGAARTAVTLNAAAPVSGLSFSGSTNYTLSGTGAIAGAAGLSKTGSGIVTINTANTFTGPVSITGGVLAVSTLANGGEASSLGAASSAVGNFVIDGATLRLVGSQTNTDRSLALGANGAVIDTPVTFQISGSVSGQGSLTKTGAGTLILAAANTHSGGTVLQSGTLVLASDTANASGLGSGGITLLGGTLRMYDNISSYNSAYWPMIVPAGASARFEPDGRSDLYGTLSGAGTLEFYTTYVRTQLYGNWSAFSGTINVTTDSDGGDFRIYNTNGYPYATLNLVSSVSVYSAVANSSIALGALSGTGGSLGGNSASSGTLTWQIGAKNLSTSYSGIVTNSQGTTALTKVGTGTLTLAPSTTTSLSSTTVSASTTVTLASTSALRVNMPVTGTGIPSGTTIAAIPSSTTLTLSKAATASGTVSLAYRAINTYTGATTVTSGGLLVNGTLSGTAVTVASGGALGGAGSIFGNVTFADGATVLVPASGSLTIGGNLSLSGNITVTPAPGATLAAGTFTLYTCTGTVTGSPTFTWRGPGYSATFNTATPGAVTCTLVADGSRAAAGVTWTGAASSAWDDSALNWMPAPGGFTAFKDGDTALLTDSSSVLAITLDGTVRPAALTVNSTKAYTIAGAGAIAGSATLTKSGAGTLTLSTANAYTGGTTLSAGTLVLGNASALGAGTVTLSGGTLETAALALANPINVTAASTIGGGNASGTQGLTGALTGAADLTLNATSLFDLEGPMTGFSGRVLLSGTGSFRLYGSTGSAAADWDLGTRTLDARSGTAIALGSLTGAAGSVLTNDASNTGNVTFTVGALGKDTLFAGVIANGSASRTTALAKTGAGALTLSGASTYTGATTVSAGELYVTGSLAATAVSVSAGATVGGTGTLGGNLALATGSRLALGIGASVTRGLTVSGTSTLTGNITVVPALLGGALSPGTYTLLTYAGALGGSPVFAWSDTTYSGYVATFDTGTAGQVKITLVAPPAIPSGLVATAGNAQVSLSWSAVSGATSYTVLRSATNGSGYATIATGLTSTSYVDTGLTNGAACYYVVTATNLAGTSAYSAQASASPRLPAPANLTATAGDAQVALAWNASAGASSYTVLRSTTAGSGYATVASGLTATTYANTGLLNGTTYYYVVTASDPASSSASSAEASATPVAPLSPLQNWRLAHFGTTEAAGTSADDADPDADSVVNLLEYALGGDPLVADAAILPSAALSSGHLTLSFARIADPALLYTVQAAADPSSSWSDLWISTGSDNTPGPVTVTDPLDFSGNPRRFLRLRVSLSVP